MLRDVDAAAAAVWAALPLAALHVGAAVAESGAGGDDVLALVEALRPLDCALGVTHLRGQELRT